MNKLWIYIDSKNWREETKYRIVYLFAELLCALIGFAVWLIIRSHALSGWGWMACFIGYPIIIARFAVFFYTCRHDFHDKSRRNTECTETK